MLVPFIRSSLIGSYLVCEQKSFISYNIGLKEPGKFSTDSGSSVHKSLELLAQKKKAIQDGKTHIENEIFDKPYKLVDITQETAFELAWSYFRKTIPHKEWDEMDSKEKYRNMYYELLAGDYNPLKLNVIQPEQYFDLTIEEDWARYSYNIQGEKYEGFLSIKGTMDLIFQNDGYLSGMDYKTGKTRVDWATGKIKNIDDLKKDKQLLLYSYAINRLFNVTDFSIIIYFLQAGGPYEIPFDKTTLKTAYSMIKDFFWKISQNTKPFLAKNSPNFFDKRKCNWCHFNKVDPKISKNKTVCEYYDDGIVNLGMAKVIERHGDVNKIFSYGSGGGRSLTEKSIE